MSVRRENTAAPPRMSYGASSMRQPRNFTPPVQRARLGPRRGSVGHVYSPEKKPPPFVSRSNSFSCANDEVSPTKLDFQSLKKRPSLLGNKLKLSGSTKDSEGGACSEKHSIVMLGAGGVGKTGKLQPRSH